MAKIDVTRSVAKELFEAGDAVVSLVQKIKEKAADGLSAAEVGAAVVEDLDKLMAGMSGLDQIPAELKEDAKSVASAAGVLGGDLMGVFLPGPQA